MYMNEIPVTILLLLLAFMGCLVGGPNNIITSAVAADLADDPSIKGNNKVTRSLLQDDFSIKVTDFGIKVTDFRIKVADFSSKVTDFSIKVTDFSIKVTDFSIKVTDFRIKVTDFSNKAFGW